MCEERKKELTLTNARTRTRAPADRFLSLSNVFTDAVTPAYPNPLCSCATHSLLSPYFLSKRNAKGKKHVLLSHGIDSITVGLAISYLSLSSGTDFAV